MSVSSEYRTTSKFTVGRFQNCPVRIGPRRLVPILNDSKVRVAIVFTFLVSGAGTQEFQDMQGAGCHRDLLRSQFLCTVCIQQWECHAHSLELAFKKNAVI